MKVINILYAGLIYNIVSTFTVLSAYLKIISHIYKLIYVNIYNIKEQKLKPCLFFLVELSHEHATRRGTGWLAQTLGLVSTVMSSIFIPD